MKEWHFYDKVLRAWLCLMIGTPEEFNAEMERIGYKEMGELFADSAKGMCFELRPDNHAGGAYCTIIWMREWETATLIHELTHAAMVEFVRCRIPISQENNEIFAFYLEHWWVEINRVRKRYPNGRTPAQAKK